MNLIVHFVAFELLMGILFILCAYHAYNHRGVYRLVELIATVPYGIVLEQMIIEIYHQYEYGSGFFLMLGDAPLAIGVGWGVIIYSAMDLSDRLNLNYWLHPFFDVLLALNIDVVMDVVAIRVGYWSWGLSFTDEWFGVHYGNFFGWISVIILYSFWIRVMRKAKNTERFPRLTLFYPFFATGLSLLCLPFLGELIRQSLLSLSVMSGILFETIQLSLLIVICSCFSISILIDAFQQETRGFSSENVDLIPASIPIFLHVFFIVLTLITVNAQQAILLLITVIMLVSVTLVHLSPLVLHCHSYSQKTKKK